MSKTDEILMAGEGVGNEQKKKKEESLGQIGAETIDGFFKLKEEFLACVEAEK